MKGPLPVTLILSVCLLLHQLAGAQIAVVQTGKSYVNLTKGVNGGTIEAGDILEIRATIAVGDFTSGTINRVHYVDTIPNNTTYIPNTLRILTNEGEVFRTFTDASDGDQAMYSAGRLRINMGSTYNGGVAATVNIGAACNSTVPGGTSGGRIRWNGRPSFYNGVCIMSASYRIQVNTGLPFGTIIPTAGGIFRYRDNSASADSTRRLNPYTIALFENRGLCANAIGANAIIEYGGTFGSGNTQNRSGAAIVPGYIRTNVTGNNPNDGEYSIVNNLSPTGSINAGGSNPDNADPTNRVFNLWDIMGDHTGAADQLAGNPPVAPGASGGYFVAIDAGYANNNAIQQTVGGLCPNTYYEFSAWFKNVCKYCACDVTGDPPYTEVNGVRVPNAAFTGTDSSGVNPNLTFSIDGMDYYTTGSIRYTGQWVKKGFVYLTGPGQTSFTLTIRNNAAGGGGNDWAIDDVTLATCTPNLNMRPSPSVRQCYGLQIDMSCIVRCYFPNYVHFRWERSTDGGASWGNTGVGGIATPTFVGGEYVDTVYYPSFLADSNSHQNQYRIRLASAAANLNDENCSFVAGTTITVMVNNCSAVLPLQLLSFTGNMQGELATLHWDVKEEGAGIEYDIESSADQLHFEKTGTVKAHIPGGNNSYQFTDKKPLQGMRYYRINMRQQDKAQYSKSIVLSNTQLAFEIQSLINPFKQRMHFNLVAPSDQPLSITLLDMYGRTWKQQQQSVQPGLTSVTINNLEALPAGMYLLRVQQADRTIVKRVVKQTLYP